MSSPEVVVVGNVGIDTNVFLDGEPDLSSEGHFTTNLDYVGQAGGYTSRGFALLGRRTAFIGHVGQDPWGARIRAELAADGIDLRGLDIDREGTARSVNIMGAGGSRSNFYDGKGHLRLRVDPELAAHLFIGARLVLFHLADWSRHLLPLARAAGAVVACDLQDVRDPADAYRADFLAAADVLFASAAHHSDPRELVRALRTRSRAELVVCGLGGAGAAVGTPSGYQVVPAPTLDLPLLDTNGAGDALAVGFLTAYVLQGRPVTEAIIRGQLAARWTCSQRASSSNLVTGDQLDALAARLG